MRNILLVALLSFLAGGACSAVDNFNGFKFAGSGGSGGGGGGGGGSGGTVDMAQMSRSFGESCTLSPDDCVMGLTCYGDLGTTPVPGNICTHACGISINTFCTDVPNAACIETNPQALGSGDCLVRCNGGNPCRPGFTCCTALTVNQSSTQVCAPEGANFCH